MMEAAQMIYDEFPNVEFIIPVAPTIEQKLIQSISSEYELPIRTIEKNFYDVLNISSMIITSSGTATLEATLLETPLLAMYRVSFLTYVIAQLVVKVNQIAMPNLIAGRIVVPELIQDEVTPENIFNEVSKNLQTPQRLVTMKNELRIIKNKLGKKGASKRIATLVLQLLDY